MWATCLADSIRLASVQKGLEAACSWGWLCDYSEGPQLFSEILQMVRYDMTISHVLPVNALLGMKFLGEHPPPSTGGCQPLEQDIVAQCRREALGCLLFASFVAIPPRGVKVSLSCKSQKKESRGVCLRTPGRPSGKSQNESPGDCELT